MKAECVLEKLKKSILLSERMVGRHTTLPILSSIKITAEKNTLCFRATNASIGIEYTISARVHEPGSVAVPAHLLLSCVQNIPGDQNVFIEKVDETVRLIFPGGRITLKTVPLDDFPTIPKVSSETVITLPIQKFIEGLKSVIFSASQSEIKPELGSVFIYTKESYLYFVATDAFRLAEKSIYLDKLPPIPEVLIPVKNAQEILKTLQEFDLKEEVMISFLENQISFLIHEVCYITSRLVQGSYPDYQLIIPKEKTTECLVLKSDILNIIKTLSTLTDRDFRLTIDIDKDKKQCVLSSQNQEIGDGEYILPATLKGDSIHIIVNIKHLLEAITSISSDSILFSFSEPTKPIVIRGGDDQTHILLIMPVTR